MEIRRHFSFVTAALRLLAACWLLCAWVPAAAQSAGQDWPSRPIRWIIPFPPGGPADINARMIAPRLAERLGQPVVIDNRPGASSNIGYAAAARAAPDGYTMVMGVAGLVTNPHVYKLSFDPIKDLEPVAQLVTIQIVLVAHPGLAANNLTEVLELARRKPGTVRCAWGASTVLQLACETIKLDGKVDITVVGYKGSAPALNDLLGGHVDMMFDVPNSAAPHVASGKLKALATTNAARGQQPFTILPSANEAIPGFEMTTWQGVFVPAGTPEAIVQRLNRELNAVLAEPEIARKAAESGLNIVPMAPDAFGKLVRRDYERYGRLIRAAGIKAD
jgi:tripartite-type tricarboxylate transporter receptor subunit TctC